MKWLISEVLNIFVNNGKNVFSKFLLKLKYWKLKKILKDKLQKLILSKYGSELFFNDLDSFLCKKNIFMDLLSNCDMTRLNEYKSSNQFIQYYAQLFIEENPEYIKYISDVHSVISTCFEIVFNTLNDFKDDDTARKIINNNKELFGNLSQQVEESNLQILSELSKVKKILSISHDPKSSETEAISISQEMIDKYMKSLIKEFDNIREENNYIKRTIYYGDDKEDSLSALFNKKQVLLLGEAGYGKTIECEILLKNLCIDKKAEQLIPVILRLQDYGINYNSIYNAIENKLRLYFDSVTLKSIQSMFKNRSIVLVLDGLDDIINDEIREKCILDIKEIIKSYENAFIFITSRVNRYHQGFGNIATYYLSGIDRNTIIRKLQQENIYIDIPESYYDLLSNPLLLSISIKVLKNVRNKEFFNRSVLFQELMTMCCGEWDKRKGLSISQEATYTEIFTIMGKLAFEKFKQSSYSLYEFDKFITNNSNSIKNKQSFINFILRTGIFVVNDTISFSHKLFKEYFAACYLFEKHPFIKNMDLYNKLIYKDEYKEMYIFYAGIIESIKEQDAFLDFIMQSNLKLYIDCVNAKSDLCNSNSSLSKLDYAKRYLDLIVNSYSFIIDKYFYTIIDRFDPIPGKSEDRWSEKKIRIVGNISDDGKFLKYCFDRVDKCKSNVLLLNDEQMCEYDKQNVKDAFFYRRIIRNHFINLSLSNLEGDSARKIAINKIKSELKSIIEKKNLIESKYLLCERIEAVKKKINKNKECNTLQEIYDIVEKEIENCISKCSSYYPVIFVYNGVELTSLYMLLKTLLKNNIDYEKCILPNEDIKPTEQSVCIWDLYSDDQIKERISKYLYFHQLSYFEMVNDNFPLLKNNFSKYNDIPYQNIVYLLKNHSSNGYNSEPIMSFYHVSSDTEIPKEPKIIDISNDDFLSKENNIFWEIRNSYLKQNKIAHELSYTQTGFSSTIISGRIGEKTPLSDSIYKSLQNSLEEVFGKIK